MNSIKQNAIEHVERSVKNLRRGLALNTFLPESKTHIKEYEIRRKQQEEILIVWEYILSCVYYPRDETIDEINYTMHKFKGENEQFVILNKELEERLALAVERINFQKAEIFKLEKQLENFHDKSLANP